MSARDHVAGDRGACCADGRRPTSAMQTCRHRARTLRTPRIAVMHDRHDRTDPLVLFMPSGKRGRFPVGTPVLDAARQLGVYVESVCGGRATCGRCQVEVQEGNFAKHKIVSSNDHISPRGAKEERYDRVRGLPEGRRLSCSAHDPRRPRHRRAAGHRRQRAGRAQGRQRPRHRAQCRRAAVLCRGRRARHAQAARRSRPPEGRAGEGLGLEGPAGRLRI